MAENGNTRVREVGLFETLHSYVRALINDPFNFVYQVIQSLLVYILAPNPPAPGAYLGRPKIAIVGAGLTGVSAAAHCVGYGFDVTLFEAGDRKNLGGIWCALTPTQRDGKRHIS